MAATMVHEVNQPLTAIGNYLRAASSRLSSLSIADLFQFRPQGSLTPSHAAPIIGHDVHAVAPCGR
jgi:hypothetical protein